MGLSIFTNASAMTANNALNRSNALLNTSMQRLGTGKRINTAADDAAGMQIASRLQSQVDGMTVARKNISNATSLLQTAEGGFNELTSIMGRMKDLATESANGTASQTDHDALHAEFTQLNGELKNIMSNTSFGGEKLMTTEKAGVHAVKGASAIAEVRDAAGKVTVSGVPAVVAVAGKDPVAAGKFADKAGMNFQIGDSTGETLNVNISDDLKTLQTAMDGFDKLTLNVGDGAVPATATSAAVVGDFVKPSQEAMTELSKAMEKVGGIRSKLGASINRLSHTDANITTMQDNTRQALGNIRDVDYSTEASNMTRQQMLSQTSMTMLKQSNSMSQMVSALLQG